MNLLKKLKPDALPGLSDFFHPVLFCVLITVFCAPQVLAATSDTAFVEKIIDGDTIMVKYKSNSLRVRLWGIDTPEYHQAYSRVAKSFTVKLAEGKDVSLQVKDWDEYGRMVAIVTLSDKRCLNEELLKEGLAWVHIYYCKEPICNEWYSFEKRARKRQIGLWRDKSPVPPWVWKRRQQRR